MIRVMNILTDSNIGGAGRCLVNYLKYCDRAAFQITVVLPAGSALIPEVERLDVPVIQARHIADKSLSRTGIRELTEIIRREKPDLVHTHGAFSGRIAARRCGVRVIYTRHCAFPVPGYLKQGPGHWLYRHLDRRYADHVIAVSPAAEANLRELGVDAARITTMMNGVEPLRRSSPEAQRELRESLGIPEGVFTAGILARLEPYKGHMLLLEAARRLKEEGRTFRILICGDGPEAGAIQEKIRAEGLEDCVLFLGFVQDVAPVLSVLDVQLNCSYGTEASSLALIEGMSLGISTVASNYGGNPWQIDNGENGLLFESGSSEALTDCIRKLMDVPQQRKSMGENAEKAFQTRFSGEIFAKNIESVYRLVSTETGGNHET